MQRTSSSEQLLQPSLLQRLVGANRDAVAPATNLLNGEPMTGGGRLAHLNLKLRFLARIASAQPSRFSAATPRAAAS